MTTTPQTEAIDPTRVDSFLCGKTLPLLSLVTFI
ncbi:hypothetical protein JOC36_000941 [Weissella uvarum]|nr:hypothetical protein [Weissella uvarum]